MDRKAALRVEGRGGKYVGASVQNRKSVQIEIIVTRVCDTQYFCI